MKHIHFERVDSTNNEIRRMLTGCKLAGETLVVSASDQYAGRGQKGHSWESSPGKNISFSLLCHPECVRPSEQFILSQAIALSVLDSLNEIDTESGFPSVSGVHGGYSVKWPNDIYHEKSKICGILIECDIQGKSLKNCIIGVGLNVNQTDFCEYRPTATSLHMIYGHEFEICPLMDSIISRFESYYHKIESGDYEYIRSRYLSMLYRREGEYLYSDSLGEFTAEFSGIEPDGHLVLEDTSGKARRYAFKEVKFL